MPSIAPGRNVISLAGIPDQLLAAYADNPEGLDRVLRLIAMSVSPEGAAKARGAVPVVVTHAVTDAPSLDVVVAETGQVLADDLLYGEAAAAALAPGTYRIEARRSDDGTLVEAVRFEVLAENETLALTVGGFLDPLANQGGPPLALVATDASGGIGPRRRRDGRWERAERAEAYPRGVQPDPRERPDPLRHRGGGARAPRGLRRVGS